MVGTDYPQFSDERRPPMVKAYLDSFRYLDDKQAAGLLRSLPKQDWEGLDKIHLPTERKAKIKVLAER